MRISDWSSDVFSSDLLLPQRLDLSSHSVNAILFRNTDSFAFEIAGKACFPLRNWQVQRRRIARIEASHILQHDRAIAHIARHRPCLIQRTGERHNAPARAAAISGLDTRNASKGSRSEEHTSELQSLMRISYAVFSLKKKKQIIQI